MTRSRGVYETLWTSALAAGLPGVVLSAWLLGRSDLSPPVAAGIVVLLVVFWLGTSWLVRRRFRYHLRTLSNLLAALREGDYSFRVRRVDPGDPFAEVVAELNALAETLQRQRVEDLEATALVRTVMGSIDVAVFAFDSSGRLRQLNEAGERLLPGDGPLLGSDAASLGLAECLGDQTAGTIELELGGELRRWEMRRGAFRQHGRPHQLLLLSDVSRTLRAEELTAWKRLIRVIGHEINNSLAPIKSIAGSMEALVEQDHLPQDWKADLGRGMKVIASRSEALARFISDCSRLAKMPDPVMEAVSIADCVYRVVALEDRVPVQVETGVDVTVLADRDQLEQVLINLVQNAAEACQPTGGGVTISWCARTGRVELVVLDEGVGLPDSANLFVPFFTTKPGGSGIGLFLSRQIVEAHGGSLQVVNRDDASGCEARLTVPLRRDEKKGGAVAPPRG